MTLTKTKSPKTCRPGADHPAVWQPGEYPTGKFNITYDYDKPEGYEETGDDVSVGDAMNSLQNLIAGDKPKG